MLQPQWHHSRGAAAMNPSGCVMVSAFTVALHSLLRMHLSGSQLSRPEAALSFQLITNPNRDRCRINVFSCRIIASVILIDGDGGISVSLSLPGIHNLLLCSHNFLCKLAHFLTFDHRLVHHFKKWSYLYEGSVCKCTLSMINH